MSVVFFLFKEHIEKDLVGEEKKSILFYRTAEVGRVLVRCMSHRLLCARLFQRYY